MKNKCKVRKDELKLGIKIEKEHTSKTWLAEKIARDHLCEFPTYYSKGIVPMKKRLTKLRKKKDA